MNLTKATLKKVMSAAAKIESEFERQTQTLTERDRQELTDIVTAFFQRYGDGTHLEYRKLLIPLTARERKLYPKTVKTRRDALIYLITRAFSSTGKREIEMILNAQRALNTKASEILDINERQTQADESVIREDDIKTSTKNNKAKQAETVIRRVAQAIAAGLTIEAVISGFLPKALKRAESERKRLLYTEDTLLINLKLRNNTKCETYYFVSMRDYEVCMYCQSLDDRKEHRYDEAQVGENFPPVHTFCRCIAIPSDVYNRDRGKT